MNCLLLLIPRWDTLLVREIFPAFRFHTYRTVFEPFDFDQKARKLSYKYDFEKEQKSLSQARCPISLTVLYVTCWQNVKKTSSSTVSCCFFNSDKCSSLDSILPFIRDLRTRIGPNPKPNQNISNYLNHRLKIKILKITGRTGRFVDLWPLISSICGS